MQKYLLDNLPLSLQERNLLYANGQQVYDQVIRDGGFVKVYCQRDLPAYLKEDDWVTFYQSKVIAYEYKSMVDGSCIGKPYYYNFSEMLKIYEEKSLSWLKHQISILTIDPKALEMINVFFNFEALKQNHGNQYTDIRVQQPGYDSFSPCRINQQLEGMKIMDYIDYLNDPTKFIRKEGLQADQRLFAVNVNMQGWDKEINHLKQFLPKCLRPQGENDGLSYLRQEIDGVNIPQIYIKTDGVWTGGHQENLSVNAININHGPADCVWITVDNEHVQRLRQKVIELFETDIFKNEGLWFKEPEFFLKNGIPFRYTLQKKGDVVILGAGCLHWVKSLGQTINTAWNQVALDDMTLEAMSERHKLNKEINYRTVIPYKNLMLDLYIHEKSLSQMTIERIQLELQNFFDQENRKLHLIDPPSSQLVECCKEVQLCSKCEHEIFLYFYHDNEEYLCLECVINKPNHKSLPISMKYRYHCFYYLLQAQPSNCNQEFCCPYTGKTKCTIQQELKPAQFKHKGQPKLNSMLHGTDKMKKKKFDRMDYEIDAKTSIYNDKQKTRGRKQSIDKSQPAIKRTRNY
ncbi:unnamed protein product [Paramecium octaurelia]|uniref:JmjC domain-containing protein n=1 Tax=Paramecium octaurelia TaxID=43137 RepID=A0A8S1V0M3_PAROT|nr:unnamed protein product [Paramecium octaurelia]